MRAGVRARACGGCVFVQGVGFSCHNDAPTHATKQSALPAPTMAVGQMSSRLVLIGRFSGDVQAIKERYISELQSFLAPGYFVLRK